MKKEHGFFLLETILLSMILVAMAAFCFTYQAMARQQAYTGAAITAAFLAQEQFALIEAQPFETIKQNTSFSWLGDSSLERNGEKFLVKTNLMNESGNSNMRLIKVEVSWGNYDQKHTKSYYKLVSCDE